MRKCRKCNISYTGNINNCPLCQNELTGNISLSVFPSIQEPQPKLLNKLLLFISFSIALLFGLGESLLTGSLHITKFIAFGLITNYILVKVIINNYRDILRMLNRHFLVIWFLFFVWYFVTKSLIITTYMIPILCMVIFAFNSVTMLVLKKSYVIRFLKIVILDCLVGLMPLLLVALKLTTYPMLSYICASLSLLVFLGLVVFCQNELLEELRKIFNI